MKGRLPECGVTSRLPGVATEQEPRSDLGCRVAWSFPDGYDLDDRKDLRACYARVMTEGLDDDVRFYIDLDRLLEVWDEMWLTPHVREAWSAWLRDRGLID